MTSYTVFLTYITAVLVCGCVNRCQAECLSGGALSCVCERGLLLLCEWNLSLCADVAF